VWLVTALSIAIGATTLLAQVRGSYLYTLSDFGGGILYNFPRLYIDLERDETYLIYQNLIRVFGPSGMEVFSFGDDLDLGQILDAAVDEKGDVILLSYKDGRSLVTRCDFRGVPVGEVPITNLPADLVFGANRMIYRNGLYYFASTNAGSVIITDGQGAFRQHIDLMSLLALEEEEQQKDRGQQLELTGLSVDNDGNILFSVAVLFRVFKYSPEGTLTSFGRAGSARGQFGIVAGVVTDSHGNLLVVDKLKCVVMAFSKDFRFLTEFGYRGARPENLIAPDDITIDRRDRIYVTQGRGRGVSVFALTYE